MPLPCTPGISGYFRWQFLSKVVPYPLLSTSSYGVRHGRQHYYINDYLNLGGDNGELQTLGELFLSINFEGDSNLKACYRMSLKILALYIYSVELRGVGIGIGIGLNMSIIKTLGIGLELFPISRLVLVLVSKKYSF